MRGFFLPAIPPEVYPETAGSKRTAAVSAYTARRLNRHKKSPLREGQRALKQLIVGYNTDGALLTRCLFNSLEVQRHAKPDLTWSLVRVSHAVELVLSTRNGLTQFVHRLNLLRIQNVEHVQTYTTF